MTDAVIPVSLSTQVGMAAFFQAISDSERRATIDVSALPAEAAALINLVNDKSLMKRAVALGSKAKECQDQLRRGASTAAPETLEQLRSGSEALRKEIESKHYDAIQFLTAYTAHHEAKELASLGGRLVADSPYAVTDIVAIAEVYANVAVATNYAVAIAVLAVIGAVVI